MLARGHGAELKPPVVIAHDVRLAPIEERRDAGERNPVSFGEHSSQHLSRGGGTRDRHGRRRRSLEGETVSVGDLDRHCFALSFSRLEDELLGRRHGGLVESLAGWAGYLDGADLPPLIDLDGEDHLGVTARGERGWRFALDEVQQTRRLREGGERFTGPGRQGQERAGDHQHESGREAASDRYCTPVGPRSRTFLARNMH